MALNLIQNRIRHLSRIFLQDTERKPIWRIVYELGQLWAVQGKIPAHYFGRHLYKKDRTNIRDYLPNKLLWSLWNKFNDVEGSNILKNKLYFNLFFSQFNISLPEILMYNHLNRFVIGEKSFEIDSVYDFEAVLNDLVKNHSSFRSVFIKKTYGSYGGSFTYRISADQLPLNRTILNEMYTAVCGSAYLFQETIQQHPQLNVINPSCLNTMRIDTFIDREGRVEIISAFLRMSSSNLHVDNGSAGGCFSGIELESGRLKRCGYSSFTKAAGKILTEHPVTKVPFEDFTIPCFEEAKSLVIQVASLVPHLRLIGWDVGIGNTGPIIIEGNCGYDITMNDLAYGGYRNNPIFRKVLEEIGYS
jgi:hypothetical protein